eukprot:14574067-Heterocapsa_arctica.AAC.1
MVKVLRDFIGGGASVQQPGWPRTTGKHVVPGWAQSRMWFAPPMVHLSKDGPWPSTRFRV